MKKVIIYLVVLILTVTALGVAIYFFNKEDTPDTPITPTEETCVLTLKVNDSTLGKCITPSGVYIKNREIELKASAINNSEFMGWYINEELISTELTFNFMLKTDTLIVVKFKGESMYTKAELEELIKLIDLTQSAKSVKLEFIRDFAEIRIKMSFDRNSSLYPNFNDYISDNLTIAYYAQIELAFDLNKTFKIGYLNCFDSEYLPVREQISLENVNNLISQIPFDKELFSNFVAVSENPINDILTLLENSYTQNEEKILNISSVYQIEVDDSIPVYDMQAPVLLNAEFVNVIASFSVDDTIPENPNLDEDGDYVIDATSLFNLNGLFEYNEGDIAREYVMFLRFDNYYPNGLLAGGQLIRECSQYQTMPDSSSEYDYLTFIEDLSEINFPSESAVKSAELKAGQTTSLNNLYNLYLSIPQVEGIHTINLASLFNFYDEGGDLITNVKFNVQLDLNFYN